MGQMTTEQARAIFDKVAAEHRAAGRRDEAANVELCREYFCNPDFRHLLAEFLYSDVIAATKMRVPS